jgi:Lrp/AsnC family leucine-responsive transcriptional regulator
VFGGRKVASARKWTAGSSPPEEWARQGTFDGQIRKNSGIIQHTANGETGAIPSDFLTPSSAFGPFLPSWVHATCLVTTAFCPVYSRWPGLPGPEPWRSAQVANSNHTLDAKDLAILDLVQRNADWSHGEIGRHVGLSVSAVNDRIRRLVANKVIKTWTVEIDPATLGLHLLAFVHVLIDQSEDIPAFVEKIAAFPEVQECHHLAGEWNYLLKVRVPTTAALERFISNELKTNLKVTRTSTEIALHSLKDSAALPVRSRTSDQAAGS